MELDTFTQILTDQIGSNFVRYAYPHVRKAFVLGGRNLTEAKQMAHDIVQTAIIASAQTFSEQGGASEGTYFVRGVFITARNAVRKLNASRTVSDSQQGDRNGAGSDSARCRLFHDHGQVDVRETFGFEDRELLGTLLGTLTESERTLLEEYIGKDRTASELTEFGSAPNITQTVNRILTKLRDRVK